jgi:hypothetical protein
MMIKFSKSYSYSPIEIFQGWTIKIKVQARHLQLMPVILATQERDPED